MTNPQGRDDKEPRSAVGAQGNLRQRFTTGVSWNVLGTVFAQGSVFAANLLIANRLGSESFGEFSLLQNTALTLSSIAQVATGVTATRYVARYRTTNPRRAGRILGFCAMFTLLSGLAASLILVLLSDWLSEETFSAPQLSGGLKIMSLYLLFSAMSGYQNGALAGLEGCLRIARLGAMHAIVHIAFTLGGVWAYGLQGALWAQVASMAVRWWLYHQGIRQESKKCDIHISYGMQKEEHGILLRFSLPAALAGFTSMPALWVANTVLVQQPLGFSQLGLFTAALNLKTLVTFVPAIVTSVGGILVQSHSDHTDRTLFRRAYWVNVFASATVVVFTGLAVFLLSDFLLSWFGEGFEQAQPLVAILIVAAIVESLMVSLYQLIYSLEKMWWSFFAVTLSKDLVIVASAFVLIPRLQVVGLAWAHVLGWSIALLAVLWFVEKNRGRLR